MNRFVLTLLVVVLSLFLPLGRCAVGLTLPMPGEVFSVQGREAFVILPTPPPAGQAIPWVWYAPTLGGTPSVDEVWMFQQFLDHGIAIAGIDVSESYGSPDGRALFTALYNQVTQHRGFTSQAVMFGRSRGGLMTLCWAAENVDKVAGFAGIYPVCNIASYPGVAAACGAYGMTAEELALHLPEHNPVDRLAPLAQAGVPLFAIHGDSDDVVPLEENSGLMASRYQALGGTMQLIVAAGQGHNMWTGFFQCPELVTFVKAQADRAKLPPPAALAAAPDNAQVTLSWTGSSGATGYTVMRSATSGSGYETIGTSATTQYTDLTAANGVTYHYVVTATYSGGVSAYSSDVAATPYVPGGPPATPTGLTAAPGNVQVTLNWAAAARATRYKLQRSTTSGSGYVPVATLLEPCYTDNTVVNGTHYYYVVSATNSLGESTNSAPADATPAFPANASVLLQEDFDYTPGVYTSVAGGGGWGNSFPGITQGAVGFIGNWDWNAAGAEFGISAADANHNYGAYYDGSTSTNGQRAPISIALPTNAPVYQSMLFGKTGTNSGNFVFWDHGGYNSVTLGINSSGHYALTVGQGATVDTTIPVNATGFDQILMTITRADQEVWGNATVNLWVNPNWSSLGTPSATGTASTAYPDISQWLLDGGGVTVDRIRVGTTLADVQINTEPTPPADAGTSTVTASPGTVTANGVSTATITVTLRNASSAAVAGKTVTLASSRAPGIDTISAASGTSNASGVVTFTVTSMTAGAPVFTATDTTDSVVITATASVTFTANPAASAATSTVTTSPGTVTANGASTATITVTLRDGSSAPIPGKSVTLTSSRGATDTISAASGTSNASGVVTFTVTSLTVGAPVFTATDVTDSNLVITATAMVTFTAVPSGSLLLQEDFNYPPGVSTSVAGGGGWGNYFPNITQGAAGFTSNWSWNAAGAKFGISAADANHNDGAYYDGSTSTNGQRAPFSIDLPSNTPVYQSMLFGKTGANNGHFVFWDHGGYNIVTLGINSSGNYALTVGQGATVDTTIPVNATGFDQILMTITRADQAVWGNATVSLWVNPNWSNLGTPAATGTASTAYPDISQLLLDGGGMAVDRIRIGTSLAEVQINPADAGTSTVAATPSPVPADGITTSTITVTLRDAGSVAVAGKTVTLASNRAPGIDTIAAASGVSNGSGVVTFTVTSATPGTPVFTATDVTDSIVITATASVTFTAVPPANASTSTVTASPTSQRADGVNTSTLTVTLRDGSSAPIPGKSVTLASSRTVGIDTISAASGTSNASGVVTFTVKSTTVGTPVFTATDVTDSVTVSQTATVSFTANPAASAGNSTVEASPSSLVANGTSTATITVTLKAGNGTSVAGKTVTLASNRGATDTISAASGTSDAAGVVTFTVTSLTDGVAIFTATATTDGVVVSQTAAVTFTAATNVIDISNAIGPAVEGRISIDDVVPVGYSGRLVGITDAYWATGGVARDLDLNGNTLTFESGGGNTMNISGAISGNGMVRVNAGGIGIFHLSGSVANTYTGTTEINNGPVKLEKSSGNALCGTITVNGEMSNSFPGTGTLLWGANNQIHDSSNLTLTVGSSMNFNGYSDTLGTLALTGDASIYLTGSTSVARFANSSAQAWTSGKELIIREWNGAPSGGGSESVFFGTSASGLSAAQIAKIGFMNPAGFAAGLYHAAILATGEVVPTGSAVVPVSPPYDLSPAAAAARTAIYTSTGRADLTAVGTPLATGTRIVFFGDSITHGGGYITPLNTAIASGAGTQGKTITLINRGINGGTAANIRDGSPIWGYPGNSPQASFDSLLVSDQADIAVVYIGINDLWWAGTTAAAYEQALRDLAASAAARGVTLIFATPAAHGESPIGAGGDDPKIDQFSAIVQTVAADTGSTFVDLRSVFVAWWRNNNYEIRLDGSFVTLKPYGLLTYDGIHPSFLGLDMVADQMAEGILAALTVGSAFDTWAGTGTGGKGLTGAAAAFDADPDHDGIPNGIEFVIGGEPNPANPGSNSRALLPTAAASGNNLVFTYTRTHAAAYLNPFVEFDADMSGSWTTAVDPDNATIAVTPGTTADTVVVTVPKGANQRLFARLKVVNTP